MKKMSFNSLSSQTAEALRLAGVQGFFWASSAIGSYQTVYLQNNGFPASSFGLLNAISCTIAIIAMTFWGSISDRTGSVRKITMLILALGSSFYALIPLIPTGFRYSVLLFLIIIPMLNIFRAPMAPFIENLTVRNCAEENLNYGVIRCLGSLMFAVAGIFVVSILIPVMDISATFWIPIILVIPAIVLIYFCTEPQGGNKEKKSTSGTGELFKNSRFVFFLIFGFVYQMAVAFECNFLPYLMTDLNIKSTNIGLFSAVRATMEIPFLFFITKLRRRFKLEFLIMLSAALMGLECLLFSFFVTSLP